MRRCKCLLYKELISLKNNSQLWIFDDTIGLIPLNSIYPLVDFDYGEALPICPYYLYTEDNIRVDSAFFKMKELRDDVIQKIDNAVKNCMNRVPLEIKYIDERHAQILQLIAKKTNRDVTKQIFDTFYDFLKVRKKYLDISPCLMIPPAEHEERIECINQAWFAAFELYEQEVS